MKRHIAPTTLAFVIAATMVMIAPATAEAGDSGCSLARAAGTYGVSDSGTVIGVGPRAAVGLLTLDAAGNLRGKVTASLDGDVSRAPLSGTYSVNPDCTGSGTFNELDPSGTVILLTATVDLVFDDTMRELRFLFTSIVLADGRSFTTAINGDARKIVP